MIAELHLGWFDYPQAAAIHKELLRLAKAKNDHQPGNISSTTEHL